MCTEGYVVYSKSIGIEYIYLYILGRGEEDDDIHTKPMVDSIFEIEIF